MSCFLADESKSSYARRTEWKTPDFICVLLPGFKDNFVIPLFTESVRYRHATAAWVNRLTEAASRI